MHTLEEIGQATGLALAGDGSITVDRPRDPAEAGSQDLALALSPKFGDALCDTAARAAVVWQDADWRSLGLDGVLLAPRPRVAMARITDFFRHPSDVQRGRHPTAVIAEDARIGPNAAIGPFVTIGPRSVVGANATIGPNASIGSDVVVGDNALIDAGARIGARCRLGNNLIVQPNAVIGADGFSFEPPERGAVEAAKQTGALATAVPTAAFLRIHSLAAVEIGDDVEIGAATTIDRGTIEPTRIGSGTKIDNQVQIGHNVQIGQTCLICAQSGIAGSSRLGDRVVLGGKTGVSDHVTIGSDVVCAASTMVASHVRDGSVMMGIPATTREQAARQIVAVRRLPRLLEQVAEIRKKLGL